MTRVGCTGHQDLTPSTRRDVAAAIGVLLAGLDEDDLVGLTSLAEGADQLFAFAVLAAGGQLHAVIPSTGYGQSFTSDRAEKVYQALRTLANETTTLPFPEPTEDSYLAAGHEVVDRCDLLVAVWDGRGAASKGGTGDIVDYARKLGIEVQVVWPAGAQRK